MAYEQLIVQGMKGSNSLSGSANRRANIMGEVVWETQDKAIPLSVAGTFKDLEVELYTAPGGAGKSYDIALYVDDVKSALGVLLTNTEQVASDSDSVHVNAGQTVEYKSIVANTPASTFSTIKVRFVPDDGESQIYMSWMGSSALSIRWHPVLSGYGGNSDTENRCTGAVAAAGVFSKFYMRHTADVGAAPNNYTRWLYRNGGATSITAILETGTLIASDLANSQAYAEGDTFSVYQTLNSSPNSSEYGWCFAFVPTTAGEQLGSIISTNSAVSNAANGYFPMFGPHYTASISTEVAAQQKMHAGTVKRMRILLTVAPGEGKSYRFRSRVNGGYGNLDITIANTDTTGTDLVNSDVLSDNDLYCLESEPISTPAATSYPMVGVMYEVDDGAAAGVASIPNVAAILLQGGYI